MDNAPKTSNKSQCRNMFLTAPGINLLSLWILQFLGFYLKPPMYVGCLVWLLMPLKTSAIFPTAMILESPHRAAGALLHSPEVVSTFPYCTFYPLLCKKQFHVSIKCYGSQPHVYMLYCAIVFFSSLTRYNPRTMQLMSSAS